MAHTLGGELYNTKKGSSLNIAIWRSSEQHIRPKVGTARSNLGTGIWYLATLFNNLDLRRFAIWWHFASGHIDHPVFCHQALRPCPMQLTVKERSPLGLAVLYD